MNKTANYQLNQWVKSDRVLMDDFNADNAKIDAAIKAVNAKADGKAAQSALDALAATVSGHTATLEQKGNCRIAVGTYTGNGRFGQGTSRAVTVPFQPKLVVVQNVAAAQMDVTKGSDNDHFMLVLVRPLETFYLYQGMAQVDVSWDSFNVEWTSDYSARAQLNESGTQYTYVAIG